MIDMLNVLDLCSQQDIVKSEVIKNHDDNLWWPNDVADPRKRLLIAGLSTRVSYRMINKYRKIIFDLNRYSYEDLQKMSGARLSRIVRGLGLVDSRIKYLKSIFSLINSHRNDIDAMDNQELINLIAREVDGASYKVAQCCVLYLRGYYCGIMPVDSGMKDMLLPCLGFNVAKGSLGHESARIDLEKIVNNLDIDPLIKKNGYADIKIPKGKPLTWWAHLVLIYYKRSFCNKHNSGDCPLAKSIKGLGQCCMVG